MTGDVIWGNMPKTPKMAGNRQFQAKKPNYKNRNNSKTMNRSRRNLKNKLTPNC